MKRLVLLATLLAFVLGMAASAHAVTMKASGQYIIEFLVSDNFDLNENANTASDRNGDFNVFQRFRTQFDFIANENLKGVLATEIGDSADNQRWGGANFHFHDRDNSFRIRRAYIDFKIPDTKIANRVGFQGVNLPAAYGGGSLILDDEVAGVFTTIPVIDEVSVVAGYARLYDFDNTDSVSGTSNTSVDAGALIVPVKLDGFKFAPFFMYAYAGGAAVQEFGAGTNGSARMVRGLTSQGSNLEGRKVYWGGTSFEMTYFDPIKVMADVNYGSASGVGDVDDRSGWMFDLAVDYTGFDFMTPELFFAWTSGEDDKTTNGSERMPILTARNWGVGSFFFNGDSLIEGTPNGTTDARQLGFWAVGLQLKDISFIEKLKHTFIVMYAKGTNDENLVAGGNYYSYGYTLTEKDHIWEVDLNNSYKLYDELTLTFDLGYINNGYDKDVWASSATRNPADAYKLSTGLKYEF
ncbi:outer membrane homotrimeric porin [Desulfovibrio aminophilus]|nr:outer membrane homotrimeric porin [Desulfovibrio aminophilus]MCM0754170.1 outer membrane homotrimeric porin [Desulfovibrio aminophilus]